MSVKLAILKSGETVIAETKELISDDKVCGYLFENPQVIFTESSVMFLEENVKKCKLFLRKCKKCKLI